MRSQNLELGRSKERQIHAQGTVFALEDERDVSESTVQFE